MSNLSQGEHLLQLIHFIRIHGIIFKCPLMMMHFYAFMEHLDECTANSALSWHNP